MHEIQMKYYSQGKEERMEISDLNGHLKKKLGEKHNKRKHNDSQYVNLMQKKEKILMTYKTKK